MIENQQTGPLALRDAIVAAVSAFLGPTITVEPVRQSITVKEAQEKSLTDKPLVMIAHGALTAIETPLNNMGPNWYFEMAAAVLHNEPDPAERDAQGCALALRIANFALGNVFGLAPNQIMPASNVRVQPQEIIDPATGEPTGVNYYAITWRHAVFYGDEFSL